MGFEKRDDITLDDLRGVYWGAQDTAFEKLDARLKPKIGKLLETKTVTLPIKSRLYYEFYDTYNFDDNSEHDFRTAYTNFKIHSSTQSIHCVEFIIGGQRIDRTYLFKYVENIPIIDLLNAPNCLPHLEKHSIGILIEFNDPVPNDTITFSYDIVEIENPLKSYEYLLYQEQFIDEEVLGDETQKLIKLYFNHPIVKLYAFLPENTVDARLILDGVDYGLVFTKEKGNDYHTLEFGDTPLNFSRIEKPLVWLTTETPNPEFPVRVYAISRQIVRCKDGRAGLMFSK